MDSAGYREEVANQSTSYNELYDRVYAVHHDLRRWLWEMSDQAIRAWYNELGEKRCEEAIPLAEVLWALVLTKNRLDDYLGACALADSAGTLSAARIRSADR
jgi:hypothetical protein